MNSKEKAMELVDKYFLDEREICNVYIHAKQCALICVNEILQSLNEYDENTESYLKEEFPNYFSFEKQNMDSDFRYWEKVKEEIKNL